MISLDIGCGDKPKGDVNIDAFPKNRNQCKFSYNPKTIKNFVEADAHFLPFQNKTFKKVFCNHVLEHCKNPFQVISEIDRVCSQKIVIRVPSKYHPNDGKAHIYAWDINTLKNLLSLVFQDIQVGYTQRFLYKRGRKIMRLFPFLNTLLCRLGFTFELFAICASTEK